jgi:hypothetical protein
MGPRARLDGCSKIHIRYTYTISLHIITKEMLDDANEN